MEETFTISEIKVSYHPLEKAKYRMSTSHEVYQYLMQIFEKDTLLIKEEAVALFLNRANKILGYYKLSSGGITGTVVDIRIILGIALKSLACGIIVAHNHPSGDIKPSQQDIDLTKRLKDSARLMEISLLDHLIVTDEAYCSFADEGYL